MLIDDDELSKGLALATMELREGEVFELRVLPSGHSGTFRSAKRARTALAKLAGGISGWDGAYFMPNPMVGEPTNALKVGKAGRDTDVTRRRWLLLDVDPERPKVAFPGGGEGKASATDREKAHAWELRQRIVADLREVWAFPDPVMADSGNGYHAMWAVDLPATSDLPERFLATLSRVYDGAAAKVDRAVKNAARIWKLPGTLACKGPQLPERPWRMARVESIPAGLMTVTAETMESMIEAMAVEPAPEPVRPGQASATFADARARYKAERTPQWGARVGTCPMCHHNTCFHAFPGDAAKWFCFSSDHTTGRRTPNGWMGDIIDLDCYVQGKSEKELLLAAGYLKDRPMKRERGGQEPPVWASEAIPEEGGAVAKVAVAGARSAVVGDRPEIVVRAGELHEQVRAAVLSLGQDPTLYTRAGGMVTTTRCDAGIEFVGIGKPAARVLLERWAKYVRVKPGRDGSVDMVPCDVSDRITEGVLASPRDWAGVLREVKAVHMVPIIRENGDIVGEGYDPETKLLVDFDGTTFPEPGKTRREAEASLERLEDLLCDFPLEGPDNLSRTVIVSMMMAAVTRRLMRVCPAYLIDSPSSSVGKNLLVDLASYLMVGRRVAPINDPKDEDEGRKKIFSALLAGRGHLAFDNIARVFGGEAFDTIMTGETYEDRKLGVSEVFRVPESALVTITGRNVKFRGDGIYRTMRARMVTLLERPDKGRDFKHKELADHVLSKRGEFVSDVLTIIRAHLVAGRPVRIPPIKEYADWTRLAREPLVWLGRPDVADSIELQRLDSDETVGRAADVLGPWWDVYHDKAMSIASVVSELQAVEYSEAMNPVNVPKWALRIAIEDMMGEKITGGRVVSGFSKRMGENAGRPIGGFIWKKAPKGKAGLRWQVVRIDDVANPTGEMMALGGDDAGKGDDAKVPSSPPSSPWNLF
jgi:hypothetical protein